MLVSSLLSCRIARWPWVFSRPVNEARDVLGDLEAIPFSKTSSWKEVFATTCKVSTGTG
jgi:hypothetical protein